MWFQILLITFGTLPYELVRARTTPARTYSTLGNCPFCKATCLRQIFHRGVFFTEARRWENRRGVTPRGHGMFPRHRVLSNALLGVLIALGGEAEGQKSVLSHTTFASCSHGGGGPGGILLGPPGALFASADGLLVCTGARGREGGLQLVVFSGSGGVAGGTEKLVGGRVGTAVQGADGGVYYTDLESQEVKRWMGGGFKWSQDTRSAPLSPSPCPRKDPRHPSLQLFCHLCRCHQSSPLRRQRAG